MKLSKSDYLAYLACPREFWLMRHHPELFVRDDGIGVRYLKETGYRVQQLAQELFADGEFEKRLETEHLLAKLDIYTGGSIYEVKSSGSVKEEHLHDLAFQKVVAEETGMPVERTFVIHVNKEYVRQGAIEPEKLLSIVDVTALVEKILPATKARVAEALTYLQTEPDKSLAGYCGSKLSCLFIQHFHPDLPPATVFEISNLKAEKLDRLLGMGILKMTDVPEDFDLTPRQWKQINLVKSGERQVAADEIRARLGEVNYPVYFLDYETVNPAIPIYDGYRPFQVMVFQFSLHVLDADGAELRHHEFLADGAADPTRDLMAAMQTAIEAAGGSVMVWSAYENTNNKNIAAKYPEFKIFLDSVAERTFDLMGIFSKGLYTDAKFKGSYSIKNVLPVMLPHMNYEHMEIKDGTTAAATWLSMLHPERSDEERDSIRAGLLEYCAMDTMAMAEILRVLRDEFYR
jgi:CRISPR/Cas system-associated exonuclease Cas4 (RecB family)